MIATLFSQPAVLLDLETTGASPGRDRITEIGLVELDAAAPNGFGQDWSSLVQPDLPIPPFITGLTGIDDAMVADAPRFAELAPALARRLEGRLLIAHNVRFDYGFLRAEFERSGISFSMSVLCSAKLSRKLYPQHHRHNLDALIERHGLHCANRHRALGDARVIGEFLTAAVADLGAEQVASVAAALVTPASAPREAVELVDDLPDRPGCFILRAADGQPLHVGAGASLRSEARRLLQRSSALGRALLAETVSIEIEAHPGVLGAALAQRQLIARLAPRHQRGRRTNAEPARESWRLVWQSAARSSLHPGSHPASHPASPADRAPPPVAPLSITDFGTGAATDEPLRPAFALREAQRALAESARPLAAGETHFGDFPDEHTARAALGAFAREHRLCPPLLGLCPLPQARCPVRVRGECRGACRHPGQPGDPITESPMAHLGRALTALARLPRATQPLHSGRFGYRETDADGCSELHVFDGPRYLGAASDADALASMLARPACDDRRGHEGSDASSPVDLEPLRILNRLLKTAGARIERVRL